MDRSRVNGRESASPEAGRQSLRLYRGPEEPEEVHDVAQVPRTRPRPALFRALGPHEPPAVVEIDGETFHRREVFKHDSWAASGIYASATRQAFCKFNRRQPVLVVPMGWLGRHLAARERAFHERLAGIDGIPASLGPVREAGRILPHALARAFVDGHALGDGEWVDDGFFPRFRRLLAEVHARNVAHVDLHKRENILVGADGRPHLIDFQISFALPRRGRLATLLGGVLRMLQRCDDYHLLKHEWRHRPDQAGLTADHIDTLRPWWIRAHRTIAVPFRTLRRSLLVWLGIRSRTSAGHAWSEAFPEVAHRRTAA